MATIAQIFLDRAKSDGDGVALRSKRADVWHDLSWSGWAERSLRLAAALEQRGLGPGDRIALSATTRLEWALFDLALHLLGAVSVPIYPTLDAEQTHYILDHAAVRLVLCEDAAQATRLKLGTDEGQPVDVVCCDDAGNWPSLTALETIGERALSNPALREQLEERARSLDPESLATIVYSSGTTGNPKGVMLSHASLAYEVHSIRRALPLSADDSQVLFLPLAHIFGRMLLYVPIAVGMSTAFAESTFKALDNMAELDPTLFASVPRLFEKVFAAWQNSTRHDGKVRERLFRWAFDVAENASVAARSGRQLSSLRSLERRYADKMVLARVRERFGKRLRFAISGGAPLAAELGQWFHTAGVTILEVYGLTECCGGATLIRPDRYAFGSVGVALPGVELDIDLDGEVLLRGPNLMMGYWDDASDPVIDEDGWLHTGDLGELRNEPGTGPEPMLYITGRRKDVIVTAGGKNVAPARIEQRLEQSPWIARAVACGDARPYLTALVELDYEAIELWAKDRAMPLTRERAHANDEVRGLIDTELDLANEQLAPFEQVKSAAVLPRALSVERGELTDTFKIKRRVVQKRYAKLIDKLYDA